MIETQYRKGYNFFKDWEYKFVFWKDFDFSVFDYIYVRTAKGRKKKKTTYADIIVMADTETSKKGQKGIQDNHICAWSISFRAYGFNIATLWGQDPFEFADMVAEFRSHLKCDEVYLYYHNASYDWVFNRKFLIQKFGEPTEQLNIKPLYPLFIKFSNGLIIKDSLVLSQTKLEKWAENMNVEHKKAVGKWDYDKIRSQHDKLTADELQYIECDVLAGVECLDATCQALKCTIGHIPYTSTGIVRREVRQAGKENHAHDWFKGIQPDDFEMQKRFEDLFAGGYTHGNRNIVNFIFPGKCKDESSAYPFAAIAEKYPSEKFWKLKRKIDPHYVMKNAENYAFIFTMKVWKVELSDPRYPMPYLAKAKCKKCDNPMIDNGRILSASYIEIMYNEIDLEIFLSMYKYTAVEIEDVYVSFKTYLPKWFTDYVFKRFEMKTQLKGVDKVNYQIEKGKLNACAYGLIAQRPVKEDIIEDYLTGEYKPATSDMDLDEIVKYFEGKYSKYMRSYGSVLPYCIAPWVTAYARRNLYRVADCRADGALWLYSDTDSAYCSDFDEDKVKEYNASCIQKLKDRGYGGVEFKGKTYYLGVAEDDGEYMQIKVLHSKCYCCRPLTARGDNFVMGGDLKLTVAGVPKKGVASLKNNINLFQVGFVFDGKTSGKLQHAHIYRDKIYKDKKGNWTGDSIDLTPDDYTVKSSDIPDIEALEYQTVEVQVYDEDLL